MLMKSKSVVSIYQPKPFNQKPMFRSANFNRKGGPPEAPKAPRRAVRASLENIGDEVSGRAREAKSFAQDDVSEVKRSKTWKRCVENGIEFVRRQPYKTISIPTFLLIVFIVGARIELFHAHRPLVIVRYHREPSIINTSSLCVLYWSTNPYMNSNIFYLRCARFRGIHSPWPNYRD